METLKLQEIEMQNEKRIDMERHALLLLIGSRSNADGDQKALRTDAIRIA